SSVRVSGAHELSIAMVLEREADVTAVDCVTYALLRANRPASLEGTRVLCRTAHCPAPPFVTSAHTSSEMVAKLRVALNAALSDPSAGASLGKLLLSGCEVTPLAAYKPIVAMEEKAMRLRYVEVPALAT